ncbi:MAG: hypothetical protein KA109_18175 [Saprospiraceae bacterium]|nr:hypothetical protein [Saprospiraceae bacterium]MBK6480100.1 hypothetical protein [Saprospiraceae bacterium]MBK6815043.1 hypothetical protein [Saprospiraceae bacterium]MBK7372087.1 hypothetical protein [Saprospiraceae bacterium]MBK7435453.1 hypothetical protein [Saprospiraceae bacterium]
MLPGWYKDPEKWLELLSTIDQFKQYKITGKYFIQFTGFYFIVQAIVYLFFWQLFDWNRHLKKVNVANRAISHIANIQITNLFLLVSRLCFLFTVELHHTANGKFF